MILCFLHGFLKIRDRCRKNFDLHRRVWDVNRAATAEEFQRLMSELRNGAAITSRCGVGGDGVDAERTQTVKEVGMVAYSAVVEGQMQWFYRSLSEKDRRLYAALEAEKLGQGGVEYVSQLLG